MRGVSRQLSQDRCSRILFVIGTERWGTRASWGLLHNKEDEGPAGERDVCAGQFSSNENVHEKL